MNRLVVSICVGGALVLTAAACGSSSKAAPSAQSEPASPATRAAIVRLLHPGPRPHGETLHVWSVRVAPSDPHFASAYIGMTGGPYGGGKGDTAYEVAMEVGGHWTVIVPPGTGFPDECRRATTKAVAALLCPPSP